MLKIDNSVFVLFVISVLCAVYFSLFSIPLFSTGKKTPSAVVKIEEKVKTLEVQVKAIMDILGMKVKAGDKGNGGEKEGEGKEGEGKEGEGKEGEEKEGEEKGAEKSEKEKTGTGMSGMPGMPNI
ncbi:hypothetical protein VCUG_00904 [Vavraia culicis subsp. floridensis]|uniref:Uncharacterized protein n=1 Tax=Vavraia culicis (isolate floridensis) TaxID=948595 RepID=L2GV86_VAVCU|nr:uncharacterized protein VCUG_00904 [Vavraia culicis subsp. floridensis]ELA47581.1 hypothetical protein VCUG_00904 [Vavraia culicis subsp. floridensis]